MLVPFLLYTPQNIQMNILLKGDVKHCLVMFVCHVLPIPEE